MRHIYYILTIFCLMISCNSEDSVEYKQATQTRKETEILRFDTRKDFAEAIEHFDTSSNITSRASSSFLSAEQAYEQEGNENDTIGFLVPDERFRHFFNRDLEIIVNDTIYKVSKQGTFFTDIKHKEEMLEATGKINEFKPIADNMKQYGNVKLLDTYNLWNKKESNPITDSDFFEDNKNDIVIGDNKFKQTTRTVNDGGIPKSVVEAFPTIGTVNVKVSDKIIHFNPFYLGYTKLKFNSNPRRKLYISLYKNDYGFAVSIGLDCKVMKKLWHGMSWGHMKRWDDGIYYGISSLVVKQTIKAANLNSALANGRKELLDKQWRESIKYNDFVSASNSINGGIFNQWTPEYNMNKQNNKFVIPYISVIDDFFGTKNISKTIEDYLIKQGAKFLKNNINSHNKQGGQLVFISEKGKTVYSFFRNDLSWNGGGYRVKDTFLKYYKNVVFSLKIGNSIGGGATLGDNDFIGSPEIESCEAIVYTKDGNGWIGAKIVKN